MSGIRSFLQVRAPVSDIILNTYFYFFALLTRRGCEIPQVMAVCVPQFVSTSFTFSNTASYVLRCLVLYKEECSAVREVVLSGNVPELMRKRCRTQDPRPRLPERCEQWCCASPMMFLSPIRDSSPKTFPSTPILLYTNEHVFFQTGHSL